MKQVLSTAVATMLLAVAGNVNATTTPIQRNGLDHSYQAAYQDALSQATSACDALGGTISSVEVMSSDKISEHIWLVSILALCES